MNNNDMLYKRVIKRPGEPDDLPEKEGEYLFIDEKFDGYSMNPHLWLPEFEIFEDHDDNKNTQEDMRNLYTHWYSNEPAQVSVDADEDLTNEALLFIRKEKENQKIHKYSISDEFNLTSILVEFSAIQNAQHRQEIEHLKADKKELVEAITKAMSIVELWSPIPTTEQIQDQHIGELSALSIMRQNFEQLIQKHARG
jgi:hypothetical protein